jgi:GTP-binding protein HflX
MFERPASGERAILVQLDFGEGDFAERLAEFNLLVSSAGAAALAVLSGKRARPDPALFAGKGKVAELGSFQPRPGAGPATQP